MVTKAKVKPKNSTKAIERAVSHIEEDMAHIEQEIATLEESTEITREMSKSAVWRGIVRHPYVAAAGLFLLNYIAWVMAGLTANWLWLHLNR